MLEQKLAKCIESYPDFPKKGILFKDVLPILEDNDLFRELTAFLSIQKIITDADAIIAIDARGFIFGSAIALACQKPLITARKEGKLPGELISNSYELEYGKNSLYLQKKAINKYNSFCIVDDLLATGGTASAIEEMILSEKKIITGLCVVVELDDLQGKSKLKCQVISAVNFP